MTTTYVRYSPEIEVRQPHEDSDVAAVRRTFARMRDYTFDKHRHGLRDAHAKSHGVLAGELRVRPDLPEELRQGLFHEPATYPVIVRLSASRGDVVPDGIAALRGMAVKVIGVPGERLLSKPADATTLDFGLCNHPTISVGDVAACRRQAALLDLTTRLPVVVQRATTPLLRAGNEVLARLGIDWTGARTPSQVSQARLDR